MTISSSLAVEVLFKALANGSHEGWTWDTSVNQSGTLFLHISAPPDEDGCSPGVSIPLVRSPVAV